MASTDRVAGLEPAGVQEAVADRPHVAGRAQDMDQRRGLDQVVGGLERPVALAHHQHSLVDEVLRVHRDRHIALGQLDAGHVRDVRIRDAGRHDQPPAGVGVALRVVEPEALRGLLDAHDLGVAAHVQAEALGIVGEVLHHAVRGWEVLPGVLFERQEAVVAEQGVPVEPEVDLGVVVAGVDLVAGDQGPVTGERAVELAGAFTALEDQVAVSRAREVVSELQPARPGPQDEVLEVYTPSMLHDLPPFPKEKMCAAVRHSNSVRPVIDRDRGGRP